MTVNAQPANDNAGIRDERDELPAEVRMAIASVVAQAVNSGRQLPFQMEACDDQERGFFCYADRDRRITYWDMPEEIALPFDLGILDNTGHWSVGRVHQDPLN